MWMRRLRSPLVAALASGLLLVLGFVALASISDKPQALQDLERAERAGERAQRSSAQLVGDLERISENLEAGFPLGDRTDRIHALTTKQAASLDQVARQLADQIDELEGTLVRLRDTRATAASIEGLSAEQARILRETMGALQTLRAMARSSSASSADLARFARYGARLAKDSQRSFSNP